MSEDESISVPIEGILKATKLQRNNALDENAMLKTHIEELYEKISELEEKLNG